MYLGVHQKTLIDQAYSDERPSLPPLRKYLIHVTCQASTYVVGVAGWATRLKLSSESVGIEPFRYAKIDHISHNFLLIFCKIEIDVNNFKARHLRLPD